MFEPQVETVSWAEQTKDEILVNSASHLCQNFGFPASSTHPYRRNGRATVPGDYAVALTGEENPTLKREFRSEAATAPKQSGHS